MAEPVDYFMQGTSLGMRAAQAAEQTRQFQTNLAERARQFDMNNKIQQGNLNLRNEEFKLAQERAVLENELAGYQIAEAKILTGELQRKTDEAKQYLPVIQEFQAKLNNWNGVGEPPPAPADVPYEIGLKIEGLRSTAIKNAQDNKSLQLNQQAREFQQAQWNEGLSWMMQNAWQGIEFDAENNPIYDFNEYMRLRSQANQFDRNLKMMAARAAYNKSKPKSIAESIQEFREKHSADFYVKDPNTDQMVYDSDGFRQAMAAYTGLQLDPNFGVPTNGNEGDGNQNEQGGLNNKKKSEMSLSDVLGFLKNFGGGVAPGLK